MGDRACMAVIRDNQILLVRQSYKERILWTFPGGAIEPGETPAEAAIREVKEETFLDTIVSRLLYEGPRTNGIGRYYCFHGRIKGGEPRLGTDPDLPEDAQELLDIRWWPINELTDHPEVSLIRDAIMPELRS